jgi:outer membrane biosynthesis protein TonB
MVATLTRDEKKALTTTIVFHVLLIILFFLTGMKYMEPPPPEEGILINFGTMDEGSGPVQANTDESTVEEVSVESTSEPENKVETEKILTQETEEAPKVVVAEESEKKKEEVKKEEPKPSKELSDAMQKWKSKSDGKSSSDGITGNPGDQGDPSGSLESGSYVGGGGGSGYIFDLRGRMMVSRPKIKDVSQDEGKVVVDIVVDKNGNVTRATPGGRGSTTTSQVLYKIAKEAAMTTKFNISSSAPEQQKGQIVFTFLLKG